MVQVALEGALFTSSMHLSFTLYSCMRYPDLMIFHIDIPSYISIKWYTQILTSSCAALAIWYGVCVAEPCSNPLQSVLDMLVVLFSGSSLGRFSLSQEKQRFISFIETHLFCNTDGGLWSLLVCILLGTTCCTYSTKCETSSLVARTSYTHLWTSKLTKMKFGTQIMDVGYAILSTGT